MMFDAKTKIIISRDLTQGVMEVLSDSKAYKICMIVDDNIAKIDAVKELVTRLKKSHRIWYDDIEAREPTTKFVDNMSYIGSWSPDLIIGMGGGSVMDLAKAASAMFVNPGSVEDYHMKDVPITNRIPTLMIPTTAGTGAEVTPGAVLINEDTNKKRALNVGSPDYAILCAPITTSMPDVVTFETGVDALAHAIESYTAKNSTPLSRMYSMEAFKLLFSNLPAVLIAPDNINARENMLIGANLAGTAIYNSNTGAAHALSYPLGIFHDVPHAQAVTALISRVVKFNVEHGCTLYADFYDSLIMPKHGLTGESLTGETKSYMFADLLDSLITGYYTNLYDPYDLSSRRTPPMIDSRIIGTPMYWARKKRSPVVTRRTYEFLAEKGMDLTGAIENNPVPFNIEDAKYIMKCLMGVI